MRGREEVAGEGEEVDSSDHEKLEYLQRCRSLGPAPGLRPSAVKVADKEKTNSETFCEECR